VFSPGVDEVNWARRVIERMGDGTGAVMVDGTMQDDASVKQCRVVVALADQLAQRDPELAKLYSTENTGWLSAHPAGYLRPHRGSLLSTRRERSSRSVVSVRSRRALSNQGW
jgi:hypothetical protein